MIMGKPFFNRKTLSVVGLFLISCGRGTEVKPEISKIKIDSNTTNINIIRRDTVGKVIVYLENSKSMFGYVNGFTQYVDVVSELSEKPMFVAEKIKREFYLINGIQLKINKLGDDPTALKSKLNKVGFNAGDITKSNLNEMFQVALDKAQGDTISLLISDGIYDIGQPGSLNTLPIEGRGTRTKFINRLQSGDLQTLLIKIVSKFNGDYFYSSKHGKVPIAQSRPFYRRRNLIWYRSLIN